MAKSVQKQRAFTIVELLIVIVIIAILATIGVLAFTGIQARTNDAAVQTDINTLVKKIKIYEVENGAPPPGGTFEGGSNSSAPGGITTSTSQSSYMLNINQFYYCRAEVGTPYWGIAAQSTSGNVIAYSTLYGGWFTYPVAWNGVSGTICPRLVNQSSPNFTFSYGRASGSWFSWARS